MAALVSSQSAYAASRGSFLETRLKSLNPVVPSSPVRVYIRVRCTAMVKRYRAARPRIRTLPVPLSKLTA